ncbi:hypothetical protein AKJ16_DCAP15931 [Drosera capensis]
MMLKARGNANKDENGTLDCLENLVVCIALVFTMLVDVEFVGFGGCTITHHDCPFELAVFFITWVTNPFTIFDIIWTHFAYYKIGRLPKRQFLQMGISDSIQIPVKEESAAGQVKVFIVLFLIKWAFLARWFAS